MEQTKSMPKYIYIQRNLIEKIESGEYQVDDFLPTEEELGTMYAVSRITVRKALELLCKDGYIERIKGSGTRVVEHKKEIKSPYLKSFTKEMEEKNKLSETVMISFNRVISNEHLAALLHIGKEDEVYYVERLRKADHMPMILARTFMSVAFHTQLHLSDLEDGKFEYAKRYGYELSYSDQKVEAVLADAYIAKLLEISVGEPLIKVLNTIYTKEGAVFDYTELYLNPHNYQLSIRKDSIANV